MTSKQSRAGIWASAIYLVVALSTVISDRLAPGGMLAHLKTFLITAPLSVPLAWAGLEPDFSNLAISLLLVAATAVLVYRAAAFIGNRAGK